MARQKLTPAQIAALRALASGDRYAILTIPHPTRVALLKQGLAEPVWTITDAGREALAALDAEEG